MSKDAADDTESKRGSQGSISFEKNDDNADSLGKNGDIAGNLEKNGEGGGDMVPSTTDGADVNAVSGGENKAPSLMSRGPSMTSINSKKSAKKEESVVSSLMASKTSVPAKIDTMVVSGKFTSLPLPPPCSLFYGTLQWLHWLGLVCHLTEIQELFSLFDADNDGEVHLDELAKILRSLGFNPSEAEINNYMLEFDTNGKSNRKSVVFIYLFIKRF